VLVRRGIDQTLAFGAPAVPARHVRGGLVSSRKQLLIALIFYLTRCDLAD